LCQSTLDELLSQLSAPPLARDPTTQYALGIRAPGCALTRGSLYCPCAQASATALLGVLADTEAPLVQAASLRADELVQAYGLPEAHPLTAPTLRGPWPT
jgi:hypothetical protein